MDFASLIRYAGIRATTLEYGSVEFFALLCGVAFAVVILLNKGKTIQQKLFLIYIVFLPYTDRVYRLWFLQPAELIVFLAIAIEFMRRCVCYRNSWTFVAGFHSKYMLVLGLLFLVSLLTPNCYSFWDSHQVIFGDAYFVNPGRAQLPPFYNVLYLCRFLVITIGMFLFYQLFSKDDAKDYLRKCLKLYVCIGTFASILGIVQFALFIKGYSVSGVFYDMGFFRVKGLAQEPTTFASYLISSFLLTLPVFPGGRLRVRYVHFTIQLAALALTVSTSMLVIMVFSVVVLLIIVWLSQERKFLSTLSCWRGVFAAVIISVSLIAFAKAGDFGLVKQKIRNYLLAFQEPRTIHVGETGKTDIKGADFHFALKYVSEYPLFGIGYSNFVFTEATATNLYCMVLVELGVIGFVLFLVWCVYFWRRLYYMFKRIRSRCEFSIPIFVYVSVSAPLCLAVLRIINFHYIWVMVLFLVATNKAHSLNASRSCSSE